MSAGTRSLVEATTLRAAYGTSRLENAYMSSGAIITRSTLSHLTDFVLSAEEWIPQSVYGMHRQGKLNIQKRWFVCLIIVLEHV